MRIIKIFILLLSAFVLISLTGCFGKTETDETAFVVAIGFDKGEKENMVLTVSIANPKVIAGDGGGGAEGEEGGGSVIVQSVETHGPLTGLEQLSTATSRHLSLVHAKAYIFSEELAQEGLGPWFTALSRYYEVRGTSYVFVCKGKAKDYLEKNKPPLELIPVKQYELIGSLSEAHGLYHNVMFKDFYQELKRSDIQPSLPLTAIHEGGLETAKPGVAKGGQLTLGKYIAGEAPITGSNKAQFDGTAVFRDDKMVGVIDGESTRFYLMLRGKFERGFINVLDPLANAPVGIGLNVFQSRSPKYVTRINEDGTVTIDVDIYLDAELVAVTSNINYEREDRKLVLEEAFSTHVREGCQALIKRTQEEFKADIFGFGEQVKGHYQTVPAWRDAQWLQRYPEAQINVAVHTRLRQIRR